MKISKLFHWLYGLVMLLPIFAIGVTCGYAMFNKNAYKSYYGNELNNYQYNLVTNAKDFVIGKTYHFESMNEHKTIFNSNTNYVAITNVRNVNTTVQNLDFTDVNAFYLTDYTDNYIILKNIETNTNLYTINLTYQSLNFDFDLVSYNYSNNHTITEYLDNTIYSIDYEKESFISEAFYYSVERVTQSNLFNWAYDSFLVAPFTYIVSLFSMPANSPVVMLLSYWLAISIIWLVFDLVMYVPLLVHRWLDKGGIE